MSKPAGFFKEDGKTKPRYAPKKGKRKGKVVRRKREKVSHSEMASDAQVAEIARKLTTNFSDRGEPVKVLFHDEHNKFAANETGIQPLVMLPKWSKFNLPVEGYESWILYRQGTWHEAQHLKFSPRGLYRLNPDIPGLDPRISRALVNIIEDRRVNDLGVTDHVGAIPGRKYEQGYAAFLRADEERGLGPLDQIEPPEAQIFEAFTQKMLLGGLNGSIPPEYEELVDDAVAYALKQIKKMNKHGKKSEEITAIMDKVAKKVADKLKLVKGPPQPPDGPDGPDQGMLCPNCGKDMLQNALMNTAIGKVRTGKVTCPHCGEKSEIAVQEGGEGKGKGKGVPIPIPGGGSGGGQGDDGDKGDDGDEGDDDGEGGGQGDDDDGPQGPKTFPIIEDDDDGPQGPKTFPIIEWDETFTPMTKKEAEKLKKEAEEKIEEFFDKEKEKAEKAGRTKRGKKAKPGDTYAEDIEKAREGTEEAKAEFERIEKGNDPPELQGEFIPLTDVEDVTPYKDSTFRGEMRKRLKAWRVGAKAEKAKTGRRISPIGYVTGAKKPFRRARRKSVKGKKYLFVLDFSQSIRSQEKEYKTAIINVMEALDEIGAKTAVFGFGGFEIGGDRQQGHFKVKDFREASWRPVHAQKVAGVSANLNHTPTATAYKKLEKYIRKERPEYVITLTDGGANENHVATDVYLGMVNRMNEKLGRYTRMVAFGIGNESAMQGYFDHVKYDQTFTVDSRDIHLIPRRLIEMIAPEG